MKVLYESPRIERVRFCALALRANISNRNKDSLLIIFVSVIEKSSPNLVDSSEPFVSCGAYETRTRDLLRDRQAF